MEKLIEDLIERLESQKQKSLNSVNISADENSIKFIDTGKVFALDYCIAELQRIIEYQKKSDLKK